jgi:hypothetical protein
VLEEALGLLEQKDDLVGAERVRESIRTLDPTSV